MSSLRQIQAARANGKLSRGPVTAAGKARSSRNALRHGFSSKSVLPTDESSAAFRELQDRYVAHFAPSSAAEQALLHEIVAARWRLLRLWAVEKSVLDDALAAAAQCLACGSKLALIHRYETRLHKLHQRALGNFLHLRAPAMRNEPTK